MIRTLKEFNTVIDNFLNTQDDSQDRESWCTLRCTAEEITDNLRIYLFSDAIAKEARRLQYEELKKEFEPKLTAARDSPVHKTTRMKS